MIYVKYAYFIILILVSNALAAGPNKEHKSDINKDGKIDYIEIYSGNILIERKEDLNFDGNFDRQTLFSPNTPDEYFKVVNQTKYDKNPKTRISYWHDLKAKKTFSLTQIDNNDDGKWDKEFQSATDMNQQKDECTEGGIVTELAEAGLEAAKKTDEFQSTPWGHQIHKSCLTPDIKDFVLESAETAIKQGTACLQKLGDDGGMGAARNLVSLNNLLSQKSIQVICDEKDYDWTGTLAHATTSADGKEKRLRHPGLSLSPEYLKESAKADKNGKIEFIRTIFHEQLHNLGYLHQEDIEYQYTCEKCCFPEDNVPEEKKAIACKICSGNYSNMLDKSYLKDITLYGQKSYRTKEAIGTNMKYVKANPEDAEGFAYLSLNLSGVFEPVGAHLAEKIRAEGKVSTEEDKILKEATTYKDSELFKPYNEAAKIAADAYYIAYKTQDPGEALALLKKNAEVLKAQMKPLGTDDRDKYVSDSIKKSVDRIVADIWIYKYKGKAKNEAGEKLSSDAYEVYKLLGL